MEKKLISKKKYPPACKYCEHGRLSPDSESVLCLNKGIVDPESKCRKFTYDPLKRTPEVPLRVAAADTEDFKL